MPPPEDQDRAPRPAWWKEGWFVGVIVRTAVEVIIRIFWHDGGPR